MLAVREQSDTNMKNFQVLLLFLLLGSLGHYTLGAKIINGHKVSDQSMLYMASVQNNEKHICGGILVSEDFVLTAAHCDKATSVVLGAHDLRNANHLRYDVKQCKHPSYESYDKGDDIMLLKLSQKAQLGDKVEVVQLPSESTSVLENQRCVVAGWGYTRTRGSPVNELLQAFVPVFSIKECKKKWGSRLPHSVICAGGYNTNTGFCQGDSGGPLVCNKIPVGIVSFNYGCDYSNNRYPNVYTEISKFLSWINDTLEKQDCLM